MLDAQFYWNLFLETGAPEAYISYKRLTAGKQPEQAVNSEDNKRVF